MDPTSLTSLPTDSLYKFMAIAGLLLTAVSVALPHYFRKNLSFLLFDLEKKVEVVNLRSKMLANDIDRVVRNRVKKEEINELNHEDKKNKLDDEREKICALERAQFEHSVETIELGHDLKKVKFIYDELVLLRNIQASGIFLGLALTILGFFFWYTKIQVYADIALALPTISVQKSDKPSVSNLLPK